MSRLIGSVSLVAFLTFSAYAPVSAQTEKAYEVDSNYDRFKDTTRTSLAPIPTTAPNIFVMAMFDCPGRQACKPEGVIFGFAIVTLSEEYRGQGIARAIRDGVRQEPHKLEYMGLANANPAIPLPSHLFRALLRPEGLTKIANSRLVEYQIDIYEFSLTPENLAGLRALANRMQ